jgi:hypothetical protein
LAVGFSNFRGCVPSGIALAANTAPKSNDTDRLAEQTRFDDSIREQRLIRLSYIATGNIVGKNERERDAELEELLKSDVAYQQAVQDEKDSKNARTRLDIENDHLQRRYRLAVATIQALASG